MLQLGLGKHAMFPIKWQVIHIFGRNITEVSYPSQSSIPERHMGSICPITGEVNFDHLFKVLSARFLHCKITIFPFVAGKYLAGVGGRIVSKYVTILFLIRY